MAHTNLKFTGLPLGVTGYQLLIPGPHYPIMVHRRFHPTIFLSVFPKYSQASVFTPGQRVPHSKDGNGICKRTSASGSSLLD